MRAIFGVLGLLVVVAIVGVLAKKQLAAATAAVVPVASPSGAPPATATPRQQVDQFQQAVQGTMQARPMPDETK